MSNEERLILNNYLEDLYQAMQIGDIVYEPKHSSELYNLINKLLKENQKYKEVIEKVKDYINDVSIHTDNYFDLNNNLWIREVELLDILKEAEHDS